MRIARAGTIIVEDTSRIAVKGLLVGNLSRIGTGDMGLTDAGRTTFFHPSPRTLINQTTSADITVFVHIFLTN